LQTILYIKSGYGLLFDVYKFIKGEIKVSKMTFRLNNNGEMELVDKKIKIEITPAAKKELATLGYDKAMGARPLNRVISDKIKNPLTDEILFGKLKKGGIVKIDFDKEFTFSYESL